MKLLTPIQMNEVDQKATKVYGIPSLLLMEHAAHKVFEYIVKNYPRQRITIVCGPGNNGGDGLAVAVLFRSFTNYPVKVWMMTDAEKLTAEGKVYFNMATKLEIEVEQVTKENKQNVLDKLKVESLIVDALFGTGIKRPIEGIYKEMIDTINASSSKIISIDIPSGINGVSGKVEGAAIKADVTITFMTPKIGLFLYPGILYTGEVRVENIGIPHQLIEEAPSQIFSIEKEEMKTLLPNRPIRSNKGTFGKVAVIGGSLGMAGAITLTSLAAYKVGCGTVTTIVPECIIEIMQQKLTEAMTIARKAKNQFFDKKAAEDIEEVLQKYDVIAIGPGMGRTEATLDLLKAVLKMNKPCVIDADALYFVPQIVTLLKDRKVATVLTPHPGEMARITGKTIEEILDNPLEETKKLAMELQVTLLLKIEKTVIANQIGNIYINRCGNSGLSKGGSGDALTGIITGLLAQHLEPTDAARLGVYLQTRAADLVKEKLSQYSYLASDVIDYLALVFKEMDSSL